MQTSRFTNYRRVKPLKFFTLQYLEEKQKKIALLLNNKTSVFETSFKRSAFQLIKPKGKLNRSMTLFYRDLWWNYDIAVLTQPR